MIRSEALPEINLQLNDTQQAPLPPMIKGAPFVGNALEMARDPLAFFVKAYQQVGPIFRIKILNQTYTVLAGPKANMFMSRFSSDFLRSREAWQGMVDEYGAKKLLPAEDGETHARLRKVMKDGYARSALNGRYQEIIEITDQILEREWQPGQDVYVVRAMQRMITEQLGLVIANQPPGDYVDDIRLFVKRILDVRVTRQRPALLLHLPDYKRARQRFFEMGQGIIDNYKPDPERPTILLADLFAASAADKELIPDSDLISAVLGPYIAGLDTVANTTAAFIYAVLKHPTVLEKLLPEVDAMFAAGTPTPQTLKDEMPVLYGALMETLRMYPIAVATIRNATRDFVFEGYRVQEGEPLYLATAVSHYLPEFFPDPYTFDIERYQKSRAEHRQPGAFAPFGLGPHTCLGVGMAEVLMMLSMATLFRRLELQLDPPDYQLKIDVTPTPGPELKFKVNVARAR